MIQPVSKQMHIRTFNPLKISRRKHLSTTLDLTFDKFVYYGHTRDLEQPRHAY